MATRTIQFECTVRDITVWEVSGKYFLNKPNANVYGRGKGDAGYPLLPTEMIMPQDIRSGDLIKVTAYGDVVHRIERLKLSDSETQSEVDRMRAELGG